MNKLRITTSSILILLTIFICKVDSVGQVPMANLTLTDGLAGETVNRIMTSHSGYVWIATDNGINYFNGKQLVRMPIADREHRFLNVTDLCETSDGLLYAATDAGLFMIDRQSSEFRRTLPEVEHPLSLLAVGDTLYIGGMQGFQMYVGGKLTQIDVGVSRTGYDNIVREYLRDDDGRIWFIGRYSLHCYDPQTGRITNHRLEGITPNRAALSCFTKVGNRFFIGTHNLGLFVYDIAHHQLQRLDAIGNLVMSVNMSADGLICVATDGSGAFLLDPVSLEIVKHYGTEEPGGQQLPTNAVYYYYSDSYGVNWFGFVRYGLQYGRDRSTLFQPYIVDGLSTLGMNVRCFSHHGSESLIGLHNGLWYVDSQRHIRHFFSSDDLGGGHIVNSLAYWEGQWYVGTFDGGLQILDPQTLAVSHMKDVPSLQGSSIGDIKVGPDGRLWIGCSDGLYVFDSQGRMEHYTEQNSPILGAIIISITFDSQGNAWLTGRNGVSLWSAASQEIVKANYPESFFNQVPYMRGARGHDSLVYMRNGPQLFYTKEDMSDFGELSLPVAFYDKWCRSMVDDMKGHLWLASERGLFRFGYDLKEFLRLGVAEGLLGDQISEISIDDSGRLFVVTSQGVFSLDTKVLDAWQHDKRYKVLLYDMRKGDNAMKDSEEYLINDNRRVQLLWNFGCEAFLASPVLFDYANQSGRLYEYRIDNHSWQLLQDGEQLDIHDLMMGSHQLDLRLAGVDGTESTYDIIVVPSLWAILELVLLVVAIVLVWLWWRYKNYTEQVISEHHFTEQALIEEMQEVQNDDVKSEELTKYQKVRIDEAECADIVKRMTEYLDRERVYTNPDLKMKDLADVLHLSAPKLSQVFNIYLGENYYDFINRYRLSEFKRLIDEGENKRYTITALSEQCGFKKSNFFSTFRKVEGMTPAEYLKKHGVTV